MARGRYHAINVDGPDTDAGALAPVLDRDPENDPYSFLPDKPLQVPVMSPPGQPQQMGSPPVPPPIDAPVGADLDLPDKPSRLADLYSQVRRTDPERAAQIIAIQARVNAPADYIDKNLPEMQKAATAPTVADFKDIENNLPGTAQFLSDPTNMAVTHDDIGNLAMHEALINHAGQAQSYWDYLKTGFQASSLGLYARGKMPDLALPEHADLLHSLAGMAGGITGDFPAMVVGGVAGTAAMGPGIGSTMGAFMAPAAVKAYARQQIQQGEVQDLPDLMQRTGDILNETAKQGIVGFATGSAGELAKPIADFAQVYAPVSGAAGAAAKAATGALPLAAESAAMEVAGKGVEGQTPEARGVLENMLMVGAMHGAPHAAEYYLGMAADAHAAQDRKNFILALGDTAEASKLRARLPEAYQAHVAELTKDGPIKNVYIEPEAFTGYFQSKKIDPDAFAAELGVSKSLDEAKETGSPVEIPLSTWATKIAGTEHYQGLADDVKFSPDQPSVREVQAAQAQAKTDVEAVVKGHEEAAKAAEQQAQVAGESPIYRNFYDQMTAAGLPHEEANANARMHEQVIKTLAARTGVDPEELASKFPLQVQSAEAPAVGEPVAGAAQSFNQPERETAPTFYSRLTRTVEDKMGGSATPEQINGMLRDIKPEERKYAGLDEFLAAKEKVTKQELLDHLAERQIQVHEVTKSASESQPRYEVVQDGDHYSIVDQQTGEDTNEGTYGSEEEAQHTLGLLGLNKEQTGPTKFSQYALPGGENYRELLFTLPPSANEAGAAKARANQARMDELREGYLADTLSKRERKEFLDLKRETEAFETEQRNPTGAYRSSHWDEPNVLAHTRLSDRTDLEGKRVLHVEEVQSDWHQAGRKQGYQGIGEPAKLPEGLTKWEISPGKFGLEDSSGKELRVHGALVEGRTDEELASNYANLMGTGQVPDAPFKKTWHEFVMKRLLRMAAERGYDKLAWTKGAEQAERYDLSKKVDQVRMQRMVTDGKENGEVLISADKDGESVIHKTVPESQVPDLVGKEIYQKLKEQADSGTNVSAKLEGDGLKVGGEGMKGFYDKILPEYLNKYTKKWGGKVGETEVITAEHPNLGIEETDDGYRVTSGDEDVGGGRFETEDEAKEFMSAYSGVAYKSLHSLDITPQMKDAVLHEGQSLFQAGDVSARGRIRIGDQGSIIDLFKGKDQSTALHEFGHYYLNMMSKLAESSAEPSGIKEDMDTIRAYLGLKPGEEITEEAHEKFARTFEAYLREGNAPSAELEGPFRRFKKWLTAIYRKATELHVEMTPAIRDVMSRMMASEDAVDGAARESGYRAADAPDESPEKTAKIRTLQEQARDIAEKQLLKEQMPELKAEHKAFLAKERERLTGEAESKVKEQPLFAAIERLNEGSGKRDAVARAGRFLKADAEGKPTDPDFETAAELHYFGSGKELAEAIRNAGKDKTFDRVVKAEVDRGMEQHADLKDSSALRAKALEAIHNEKMTELLALEREALVGLMTKKMIGKEVARRKRIDASVSAKAAKDQAQEILSDKPVKDATNSRVYVTAERNAAVKAARAMGAGDMERAAEYKRQQMLNNALAREAMKNKEVSDRAEVFLDKYANRGRDMMDMPYGYIRQIDQILGKAGMAEPRAEDAATYHKIAQDMAANGEQPELIANATGYFKNSMDMWAQETLADFAARLNKNFYDMALPDSVMNAGPRDADSITMGDLKDIHDSVKIMSTLGKTWGRFIGGFKTVDIKQAAKDFRASVAENYGTPHAADFGPGSQHETKLDEMIATAGRLPGTFTRQLDTMLTTCNKLDGLKEGPAKEFIFRPFSEAQSQKWERTRVAMEKMDALFAKHYALDELAGYQNIRVNVDGRFFTKSEILCMALNFGNDGNLARLRDGFHWDQAKIEGILDQHLSAKDMDFAQDVWTGLHDDYWADIVKLETVVNGIEPRGVEPREFAFKGKTYEGGYYPIDYDFEKCIDAFKNAEQKSALAKQFSTAKAYTDTGHTQARVAYVNRPLLLSLDVLRQHHENVIHDLEFRKAVIDVSRFLNERDTKTGIAAALGVRGYSAITDWVKAAAGGNSEPLGYGDQAARWFRFKATFYNLAYRLASTPKIALENIVNISSELGISGAARAMKNYYVDSTGMHQTVIEKSEFMRQRANHLDRDLADINRKWQGEIGGTLFKDAQLGFQRHAFFIHAYLDQGTSFPLWADVYNRKMAEHGNERLAINQADESVKNTFMSGGGIDQSAAMRGGEKQKLLTTAFGYQSMMWNRFSQSAFAVSQATHQGDPVAAAAIAARAFIYQFAMPAAIGSLSTALLRNSPPGSSDPDQKKRIAAKILEEGTPLKFIPVVRDVAPYMIKLATGDKSGTIHLTPLDEAAETLLAPIGQELGHVFAGTPLGNKFGEHSANAVSLLAGFPKQMNDQVFNFIDWQTHNGQATWRDAISRKVKR